VDGPGVAELHASDVGERARGDRFLGELEEDVIAVGIERIGRRRRRGRALDLGLGFLLLDAFGAPLGWSEVRRLGVGEAPAGVELRRGTRGGRGGGLAGGCVGAPVLRARAVRSARPARVGLAVPSGIVSRPGTAVVRRATI
jgi:hypothetical protein